MAVCPECRTGKHQCCNGNALDPETDEITVCGCEQIGGHR